MYNARGDNAQIGESIFSFLFGKELFVNELPQHREHDTLRSVRDELGLQASAHEPDDTAFREHTLQCLRVADGLHIGLFVNFNHAD